MNKLRLTLSIVVVVAIAILAFGLGLGSAASLTHAQEPEGVQAVTTPWAVKGNKITANNYLGTKNRAC